MRTGEDRLVAYGARAGFAGAVLFLAVTTWLGFVRAGYDPVSDPASALGLGDRGWVMNVNFIVFGVLEAGFGWALWRRAGEERLSGALIALTGLAAIVAGLFVTDPTVPPKTAHAIVHVIAVVIAFAALSAAAIVCWRRGRDGFAALSAVTGLSILPLFVLSEFAGPVQGLVQRCGIAIGFAWLLWLAARAGAAD